VPTLPAYEKLHLLTPVVLAVLLGHACSKPAASASESAVVEPEQQHASAADSCSDNPSGSVTCGYDYKWHEQNVEAIVVKPKSETPVPGLLLLPGYQRTARDFSRLAEGLARHGFASVTITLPGYGQTQVKPDFVGPNTIDMLQAGFERFQRETFVDPQKLGIFGYSRGGIAASLLVLRLPQVRAAVFGGAVYDLAKAYAESLPGIRTNIEAEAGVTEAAMRERSSIMQMEKLPCPVLIVHGEQDDRVPVDQAYLLRDRLQALGKEHELKIFPGQGHNLNPQDAALSFFESKLQAH
jgi:dipeptidyl aminopeptidase/acylaminoacyl peptidase